MDRRELLNDPEEALRLAMDGRLSNVWTAIPCIVTKVNLAQMTVELQPTITANVSQPDGTTKTVNLPILADVPICFPSAGGFILTLPIAVNDEVLGVFSSRCIDSWWQNGGIGVQVEPRMHDLSDCFAIPGPRSVPKVVSNISSTAAQLRNDAGTVYLEVGPSGVKLKASAITLDGNVTVTGTLNSGNITATQATINSIPFTTHKHTGVTTGSGTSGGPTP